MEKLEPGPHLLCLSWVCGLPQGSAPPGGPLRVAVGHPHPHPASHIVQRGPGGKPIPEGVERSLGPDWP